MVSDIVRIVAALIYSILYKRRNRRVKKHTQNTWNESLKNSIHRMDKKIDEEKNTEFQKKDSPNEAEMKTRP